MTLRPSIAGQSKQRPSSAIYIGSSPLTSTSTPPDLPRLPEPPSSPGGSSNASDTGLPSPPATNSTGSVGDDSGTAREDGSLRGRTSAALNHRSSRSVSSVSSLVDMYDGQSGLSRRSSRAFRDSSNGPSADLHLSDDDEKHEYDDDHDDDTTARFDSLSRRHSRKGSAKEAEHNSALQRVKSLTERNRMVLSKLSSMQRLTSPAPTKSRTPLDDSPTPHSRTSTATSISYTSTSMLRDGPPSFAHSHLHRNNNERTQSGSETERENQRSSRSTYVNHQHSSSDSMSATPTSAYSEAPSAFLTASSARNINRDRSLSKNRRMSAPVSPGPDVLKSRQRERPPRDASPEPTPGPSQARTPRKRLSQSTAYVEREETGRRQVNGDGERGVTGEDDILSAALAAVAVSRAESVNASASRGKRVARNPLPSAFKDGENGEGTSYVQSTPRRNYSQSRRSTPSPLTLPPTTNGPGTTSQWSPRRRESTKASNLREVTRRTQTRYTPDDQASSREDVENEPTTPSRSKTSASNYTGLGRRQTPRHGSAEILLSPTKRFADQSFRAVDLSRREGGVKEDPFTNGHAHSRAQSRRTHSTGAPSMIFGEDEWESPISASYGGLPRPSDPRTPGSVLQRLGDRPSAYMTPSSRPVTSMAALHHERVPQTAPPASRPFRATHEREASTSAVTLDDRPPSSGRVSTLLGSNATNHAEHRRLMLEALGMFESQLSRLPPMGHTTTTTIPEVFQTSQQFVHALDKLNTLIRASVSEAIHNQIEADIADPSELQATLCELWSKLGHDEREKLKLSDEIMRTTTQFLLGIGKVLRDASAHSGASSHLRTVSLDDEMTRRLAAEDGSERRSSDGRRSRETRRSWDPRDGGVVLNDRLSSLARTSTVGNSRPSSALHSLTRGSSGGSSESRSTKDGAVEQTSSAASRLSAALASTPSTRRLYTPRDKRVASETPSSRMGPMSSHDSQETIQPHEPSPTPASRQGSSRTHLRMLSSIAPSLPTLPSESLLRGKDRESASPEHMHHSGRKISTNSNMTVRAEGSLSSVIKPPSATTAITTTDSPPSMSRTSSRNSVVTNGVTFSRPSAVSISALNGLQQQVTGASRTSSKDSSTHATSPSPAVRELMSGSETERPRTSTVGAPRGRASLDAVRTNVAGTTGQASTLNSARRERRRTITEIFAQVNHNK